MVKKLIALTFLSLILLAASIVASIALRIEERPAQQPAMDSIALSSANASAVASAEKWLEDIYSRSQLPSFSAAIGIGGNLVWAGAIGYANLKNQLPAEIRSKYRIGSVSKSMTATALLKLTEQRLISLDESFAHYVQDFESKYTPITIRDLASHQAGIRHYPEGLGFLKENFSKKEYPNTRDAALMTIDSPLLFESGKGYRYTTHGYTFLSLAMENAYEKPFEELMTREVFAPLKLSATAFDKSDRTLANETTPYLLVKDKLIRAPDVNLSYKYAAGGYLSTPSDVVAFGNALLKNTLLSKASKQALWRPAALDSGEINHENYALGFRVGSDELGKHVYHGGKSIGGYAHFVIYTEHEIVVAFMTNATPSGFVLDRAYEARQLVKLFLAPAALPGPM